MMLSRRRLLLDSYLGLGGLALLDMLASDAGAAAARTPTRFKSRTH